MIYDSPETEVSDPSQRVPSVPVVEGPADESVGSPPAIERARDWASLAARRMMADPVQAALFVTPTVVLVVGAWVHRFVNEDGFINFHVVQQITAGNGPVFNPGERVEAYTSPLFIAVLTAGRLLFGWGLSLPKIAVGVGIIFSTAALIFGMLGASQLASLLRKTDGDDTHEASRRAGLLVPIGALLVACTPPMWRWATSGLETSLSFVWIAACFWALARRHGQSRTLGEPPTADRPRWILVLIGFGFLVRPEFVLYTLCFLAALYLTSVTDWRAGLRGLSWAMAIPLAYQVFRMGYFAALVPNTAIAKSSDSTHWDWGLAYAKQFLGVQWLWIALLAVATLIALVGFQISRVDGKALFVLLAPVAGVVLHVLYIQKVGGDYMYARFYMPSFFALALPVMAVLVPRRRDALTGLPGWQLSATMVAMAVLAVWSAAALVNGKILDANTGLGFGDYGMLLPGSTNPVEPTDYGFMVMSIENDILPKAAKQPDILIDSTDANHKPIPLARGQGIVVKSGAIGVTSYVAGPDMWIIDDRGLADPYAGRLYPNTAYGYAGHEKLLSWEWVVARWAGPQPDEGLKVQHIRRVMQCQDLRDLNEATTDAMTPGRFIRNIALSRKLSSLRIFDDPVDTERWVCGPKQ